MLFGYYTVMSILSWIVFGLIVGLIAQLLNPNPSKGGILSSAILGIVGAVTGGFVADALLGISITGFNLSSFVIAVAGAIVVVGIQNALVRKI